MLRQLDRSHTMCTHLIWGSSPCHCTAIWLGSQATPMLLPSLLPTHPPHSPQLWTGMQHSNISVHKLLAQQRLQLLV